MITLTGFMAVNVMNIRTKNKNTKQNYKIITRKGMGMGVLTYT